MADEVFDIVVIGGGINGAGIAADAAGRGLRVLLAEAEDLGGATSSASSKLIHGGLRYLEQYAFRLVREALAEREVLLAKAPHIVWPLQFILPRVEGMRPAPVLRAGLFVYDHLSQRRTIGRSHSVDLHQLPAGQPLKANLTKGYSYWDCWVDDARLVVLNAIAARDHGATVLTRTPVTELSVSGDFWKITLGGAGGSRRVNARAVVNAAGPWVEAVAGMTKGPMQIAAPHLRLVKGSHIVVPRIAGANTAYIFQNTDGRVVFALPFERAFTLIGTTDQPFAGDPRTVAVTPADRSYLLDVANRFFVNQLTTADIVWDFAGVRPLDDDGNDNPSSVSRDYRLDLLADGSPPLLHVIGGKITTYRRLAEAALVKLEPYFPSMGRAWTGSAPLPGGDVGARGFDTWFEGMTTRYAGIDRGYLEILARRYGTRLEHLIGDAQSISDFGTLIAAGLTEREIKFLKSDEWAVVADDIIWRRTKAGLHVSPEHRPKLLGQVQSVLDSHGL